MAEGAVITPGDPIAGPSKQFAACLPYTLDLSCPIGLSSRSTSDFFWPFPTSKYQFNDSPNVQETIKRWYLETLYIPETLCQLRDLSRDLLRSDFPNHEVSAAVAPLLLTLSDVEKKYRKNIAPILLALSTIFSSKEIEESKVKTACEVSSLEAQEIDVIRAAVKLRQGCRAVKDGDGIVNSKKLTEELEKREIFVQIILHLVYIIYSPNRSKKKKRDKSRNSSPAPVVPSEQPKEAVELLFDRLSVWQAVADLGMEGDSKGKEKKNETVAEVLERFWQEVILAQFFDKLPDICKSFHLKVFGKPYRPPSTAPTISAPQNDDPVPPTTHKKPRKPKLTHPRPSTDSLSTLPHPPSRSLSRAPSEISQHSVRDAQSMNRSASHTSDITRQRSRSRSIDMTNIQKDQLTYDSGQKKLMRAPSNKDLFKGREVGLRRSASFARKDHKSSSGESQNQSLAQRGLLGRKTSSTEISKPSAKSSGNQSETLIFATPSKPRMNPFGLKKYRYEQPTPIMEEPSSSERGWVAETPRVSRVSETPGGVSETPGMILETPAQRIENIKRDLSFERPKYGGLQEIDEGEESDPLGDLMVDTDEEDNEIGVLETPMK